MPQFAGPRSVTVLPSWGSGWEDYVRVRKFATHGDDFAADGLHGWGLS
jgi:hypothetical protein